MAFSCGEKSSSIEVMTEDEMINFLIDLHLAEANVQDLRLKVDSAEVVFATVERLLYKQHGTTDSMFINSYQYYLERPEQLEIIYTAVIDSLSLRQVLLREGADDE
jgi:hypothetical protein